MTPADLREWMARRALTTRATADLLGVSQAAVSRWATGARPIPPMLALALETLGRKHKPKREGTP